MKNNIVTIEIYSFKDILNLFDSTNLDFKILSEMILKYNEAINKTPLFIHAEDKANLKNQLQQYIKNECKGFFFGL